MLDCNELSIIGLNKLRVLPESNGSAFRDAT